jgi:NADH:ubiquinone oxidoreductase subunit E
MALTLKRFFQPAVTIRYPEEPADVAVKYRGRLQLLYDEHGTLKCETCFQCAQACPIECIDMGGRDTLDRYAVHWGAAETYGERREESARRRAGREVPDPAYAKVEPVDAATVDRILEEHDHDPHAMLAILEAVQAAFGHLPVGALKRISHRTGAWYAMVYGTASCYRQLTFERTAEEVAVCRCTACLMGGGDRIARALRAGLGAAAGDAVPESPIQVTWWPSHLPGAPAPLVLLDGDPQPEVTAATAATWAAALAGRHPASRTVH